MGANGESPRELVAGQKGNAVSRPQWSPDGGRVAFLRLQGTPGQATIESVAAGGGQPSVVVSLPKRRDYCWVRDGRMLYAVAEPPPNEAHESLWELKVNPRTGVPSGKPRRYTNLPGIAFTALSVSNDGKRVAYLRGLSQSDIWVGQLRENAGWVREPWKLTLDEADDWPSGWTPDSRSVLFVSKRTGNYEIYRQEVDGRIAEPVVRSPEEKRAPQVSPDGAWILYWSWPRASNGGNPGKGSLMRTAISGGTPRTVLELKAYPGQIENYGNGVSRANPSFRCSSRTGGLCIIAEPDDRQLVFSVLDPMGGRKQQIVRVDVPNPGQTAWDVSPDGGRIVVQLSRNGEPCLHRVFRVTGERERDIAVEKTMNCLLVAWAANSRSLFVTRHSLQAHVLMHVTLDGKSTELRRSPTWFDLPRPSPDGRYLAFADSSAYKNAFVLEEASR